MVNIDLLPTPSTEWEEEYRNLVNTKFLSRKYNREKRLKEKSDYIDQYLPEIKKGNGFVLDIGPGPGEFLEVCRHYGNGVVGVDAKVSKSMMGYDYCRLSQLLAERQKLDIRYIGFYDYLKESRCLPFKDKKFYVINSQGAIEQILMDYMEFPDNLNEEGWIPSHNGKWKEDVETVTVFENMFKELRRVLSKEGVIFVYANGSVNNGFYNAIVGEILKKLDMTFELIPAGTPMHRIRKK